MDGMLNACGTSGMMQGPAIAAMAVGAGLSLLLWLGVIALGAVGIAWLVRSLGSKPELSGGSPAPGRS